MREQSKSLPLWAQILLTVFLLAGGGIVGGIFFLYRVLVGENRWITGGILLLGAAATVFLLLKIWRAPYQRKYNQGFAVFGGVLLLVLLGYQGYLGYLDNIATMGDEVNLREYQPFTQSEKLARLEEPASLGLTGDLPRLDGATALYPVYAAMVEAVYPQGDYPCYEGPVQCNTTPKAYDHLISGEVDLILAAAPSKEQIEAAERQGVELSLTPVGREAFVFFVNTKNPVEDLTLEQIQGIYSGQITNWSELGGKNQRIRAFQRPANSGSQSALERLMDGIPIMEPAEAEVISGMGGILRRTADYKNFGNAIGYSFRFYASEMAAQDQIRFLKINGVYPEKATVRDGSYPISNAFYAVTRKGEETENTRKLLDWMLGEQGQRLIEESGYLPG